MSKTSIFLLLAVTSYFRGQRATIMTLVSLRLFSFLHCLLVIVSLISQARVEADVLPLQQFHYFCDFNNDRGNYTTNSTYDKNLNTLLSTLTSNTKIDYGFYNSSHGRNTNKVNAIGFCRGDMKPDECRSCLDGSRANLTQVCRNRKEAIGWYNDEICMLRYSDRSIFGLEEIGPAYYAWNLNNATDAEKFNEVVKNLLNSLRSKAASGDSRSKYGIGRAPGPGNQTVYGLVQCTPDLSAPDCDDCLVQSIKVLPDCCSNRIGARIIRPSCNLRYETSSPFYEPLAEAPSPSLSPSPSLAPPMPQSPSPSPPLPPPQSPSPLSSPAPLLSSPTPSSPEGMKNTSSTAVTTVPLLVLLLCSILSLSI